MARSSRHCCCSHSAGAGGTLGSELRVSQAHLALCPQPCKEDYITRYHPSARFLSSQQACAHVSFLPWGLYKGLHCRDRALHPYPSPSLPYVERQPVLEAPRPPEGGRALCSAGGHQLLCHTQQSCAISPATRGALLERGVGAVLARPATRSKASSLVHLLCTLEPVPGILCCLSHLAKDPYQ